MPAEPTFSPSDLAYITAEFRTLEHLCAGRDDEPDHVRELISAGRLPQPTYVIPGGVEMFPPDYFDVVDDAGGIGALPEHFRARYLAASGGRTKDAAEDWADYLSGQFGVCLRSVTPEAMVEKVRLIEAIERLVTGADETATGWSDALRAAVDALDALERPFTDFDRQRWGDTSRDRHVTRVRERFLATSLGRSTRHQVSHSIIGGVRVVSAASEGDHHLFERFAFSW